MQGIQYGDYFGSTTGYTWHITMVYTMVDALSIPDILLYDAAYTVWHICYQYNSYITVYNWRV